MLSEEKVQSNNDLEIKNGLFELDGVIGRMPFFINGLILFGGLIVASIPLALGPIGAVISLPCYLTIFTLGIFNNFKRLRDLRGTTDKQLGFQIALTAFLCIPYAQIIPQLFLTFAEGAVTGNGKWFQETEDNIANAIKSKKPLYSEREKHNSSYLDNIEQLHKLKESGAITEEEFLFHKNEIFKKVS